MVCQPALLINSVPAATFKAGRSRTAGRLPSPPSWALCPQCCLVSLEQLQGISAQAVVIPVSITELCLLPSSLHHSHLPWGSENSALAAAHMPSAFHQGSLHTQPAGWKAKRLGVWGK